MTEKDRHQYIEVLLALGGYREEVRTEEVIIEEEKKTKMTNRLSEICKKILKMA